ncbi:hypothetical protein ACF3M1_09790 [Luteimonas sp. WGS1318]|uniref:hypothetical protein n=1 Tax=Luteimonas sp. WGS1318 TaxID=3366815 RepID=UPI00372D4BC1
MSAPRTLLFALLVSAILLPAHAQMPSSRDIADHCADAARATPTTVRPASGLYILERFESFDDETAEPVPSPLAPEDALDPAALGQVALSTLAHTIARDIEAELEAASRLSWIELDADARTAVVVGTSATGERRATFTPDFNCLRPDDGETPAMRVTGVASDRFALQIRAFTTHRLTWRRVDADSAELEDIRRARADVEDVTGAS